MAAAAVAASSKKSSGDACRTRGMPSTARKRASDSSIAAVGPPPPSPWPKSSIERLIQGAVLLAVALRTTSPASAVDAYVSAGGQCVSSLDPSRPTHEKVVCGILVHRFHDSFWVRK